MRCRLSWWTVTAAVISSAAVLTGATDLAPNNRGIVFTRIAAQSRPTSSYGDKGQLVLLDANGTQRVLTADFHSAADPAVSFDGKRILFAGKKAAGDLWNIFEMAADGTGIRQITRDIGNCRSPMYQSALFYLNDERPSYQITFTSDAAGEKYEHGPAAATNLYSVRMDGTGVRRLTYTLSASSGPYQMQDGRILFSSWQGGRMDLYAVHLDGTDYAAYSGPQGRRMKHMACATANRMVVFVESDQLSWDGAGTLATLSLRRNLHSYKALTAAADGLFHSPSPLADGSILVSRRPATGGEHAVYRMDLTSGARKLVVAEAGYHCIQAVALVERVEPDGHSSVVEDDQAWSKLYGLSVYENDLKAGWLPPGTARRIRAIEGLPPMSSGGATTIQKRLLGETDLEEDGSFHLQVPPNTPIQLQILDQDGMALRTCSWIWAKNKENRGCIGCHEDNERTPRNAFPEALSHAAVELTLPPERRRTVDFRRDIEPILNSRCANRTCHGGAIQPNLSSAQVQSSEFTAAYKNLLAAKYVDPGRARTSRLVWAISGRNTSRPWDSVGPAAMPKTMPPKGSQSLTDEERRIIIEWIDLGAQYKGGQR